MKPHRIAIVGGGISGVSAAYEASLHPGLQCTLSESSDRLGGTLLTQRVTLPNAGDFLVELGPDGWVSEKTSARDLAIELGLGDQLIESNDDQRRTLLLRGGELLPFPEGMRMMVPLNEESVAQTTWLSDAARQPFREEPTRAAELKQLAATTTEISVADFVRRHYGAEVTRTFAGPLLAGVFGGDIERLSARSVMPAFLAMEREYGSLAIALRARAASRSTDKPHSIFTALRGGNDQLISAMAAKLPPGCIRMQSPVASIHPDAGKWNVRGEIFDDVLLATPPHVTRTLLGEINPRLAELHTIPTSSGVMVGLLLATHHDLPAGFGFLVEQPQPGIHPALLAATFSHQKYPHSAPPGAMLLRVFFGGTAVRDLDPLDDLAIAQLAHQQLQIILPSLPSAGQSIVQRWPQSLPQYEIGHQERVEEIESLTAEQGGLHLLGNAYRGVGIPDMVRRSREIVRNLLNR